MSSTQSDKYAYAAQEDRSAHRVRLSIPATFRAAGGNRFQTVVRDLSLSGFSATAITRIPVGTQCWVTLPGLDAMQAKSIWWERGLVGCALEQLLTPTEYDAVLARWRSESVYEG
jgi:PilZ domain